MPTERRNPFVGPHPLEPRDGIYGRDEEIRELLWFFTAERIVWLHSPSGAGKTSLVQAGLIPKLEKDDFEVLPIIRMNREGRASKNRYEASALSCLNADSTNLRDFLAARKTGKSSVLILDQFEEVLTLDSTDIDEKKAFFEALGRALQLPGVWALFVVREDFLPAFDPYVRFIPTLMNHRFRLELLTVEQAQQAMEQIAVRGGRTLSPEASAILGPELAKPGRFVEPVILQVVCRSMWEEMSDQDTTIETRHVPTGDKVSKALATYYATCVKSVAGTPAQERTVRKWIGEKLVVSGVRNRVLDAAKDGAGLGAELAGALVKTHLIRPEEDRSDRTWYELAHDRLVAPIVADNQRWTENLHWVQKRADLWSIQNRPKTLLLVDEDLEKAELWLQDSQPPLTPDEDEFLIQSREEQKVLNKVRFRTKLAWIFASVATALFLTAMFLYLGAKSRELINLALREVRDDQLGCAVQHGVEALARAKYLGSDQYRNGMETLSETLQGGAPAYELDASKNLSMAFSPATSSLAVASDNQVTIYHVDVHKSPETEFRARWTVATGCTVTAVGLNPEGDRIAIGLSNGESQTMLVNGAGAEIECKKTGGDPVEALAFSKTGALASATSKGIQIDGRSISTLDTVALVFHPDGDLIAAGLRNGSVQVLDRNGKLGATLGHGKLPVTGLAWSMSVLAAASRSSEETAAGVWDASFKQQSQVPVHAGGVAAIALSPDGSVLATAGLEDRHTRVWKTGSDSPFLTLRTPPAKEAALTDVRFLDNTHLLVSDSSGAVRLFPLDAAGLEERASDFLAKNQCKDAR